MKSAPGRATPHGGAVAKQTWGRKLVRRFVVTVLVASLSVGPMPAHADITFPSIDKWLAEHGQRPISLPIVFVFVGAALIFGPLIFRTVDGSSLFGGGSGMQGAPGGGMSCPVFIGAGTLLGENGCAWSRVTQSWTNDSSIVAQSSTYRVGAQFEFAEGWFLAGVLGAGSDTSQSGEASSWGQTFDGSVTLKRTLGPWLFAGAVSFASNSSHESSALLQADATTYSADLRLRGAYDFAFAGWYLRPRLDVDLYYTSMPGSQMWGAGGTVMTIDAFNKTGVAMTPMLELGGRVDFESTKMILRPYLAAGLSYQPTNTSTFNVNFTGPLAAFGSGSVTETVAPVLFNLEAGLQLYREHGIEMRIEYGLSTGNSHLSQSASLRGSWHF